MLSRFLAKTEKKYTCARGKLKVSHSARAREPPRSLSHAYNYPFAKHQFRQIRERRKNTAMAVANLIILVCFLMWIVGRTMMWWYGPPGPR